MFKKNNTPYTEICCLSTGRTGTNYICSLLGHVNNILTLYEIFHPLNCYLKKTMADKIKRLKNLNTDAALIKYAHSNIPNFMNHIRKIKEDSRIKYLFYKILAGDGGFITSNHLNMEELEEHFFTKANIAIFLIIRNPLYTYISFKKAWALGTAIHIDTSGTRITFNCSEFMNFINTYNKMCENIIILCKKYKKRLLYIAYEEIMKFKTDLERLKYLSTKFLETYDINLNIPTTVTSSIQKQDHSNLHNSITNYNNMVSFLTENNLGSLINHDFFKLTYSIP